MRCRPSPDSAVYANTASDETAALHLEHYGRGPDTVKSYAIVFHDICTHDAKFNCHVDKFWNGLKQGREHWEFIENPEQGMFGIGIIVK